MFGNELLDDGIVNRGSALYSKWVEMGFDPQDLRPSDPRSMVQARGFLMQFATDSISEPDTQVAEFFAITKSQWHVLNESFRRRLRSIASHLNYAYTFLQRGDSSEFEKDYVNVKSFGGIKIGSLTDRLKLRDIYLDTLRERIRLLRSRGEKILTYANDLIRSGQDPITQLNNLIGELDKLLNENYLFTVYAADKNGCSINYGLDVVYRQEWQPVNYQVGKLIKTIPLAPNEIKKYSKKITTKVSKSVKEVENNLHSRKTESSETHRS